MGIGRAFGFVLRIYLMEKYTICTLFELQKLYYCSIRWGYLEYQKQSKTRFLQNIIIFHVIYV